MGYTQGLFKPKNPGKYVGNRAEIIYRSGWELKLMDWLDRNPKVIEWSSEEVIVPYRSPIDGKMHRYFPDFVARMETKNGIETFMVEVKPKKSLTPPRMTGKGRKAENRFLYEMTEYARNDAKWRAAREFCRQKGMRFQVITEKELDIVTR